MYVKDEKITFDVSIKKTARPKFEQNRNSDLFIPNTATNFSFPIHKASLSPRTKLISNKVNFPKSNMHTFDNRDF